MSADAFLRLMRILPAIAAMMMTPLLHAVEWSIEQCSSLDLLAGRTGIADVRPANDPHHNPELMVEQNSGIYRGQWSWQSEMPELLYDIMHTGEAAKVSPSGFTALHAACVYADENLFYTLLDAGIPVDARPGDWQQLGYVGDTPLGLLVRFSDARTAAARLRMARALLERGADPDAPMTTWKGNRVVTTVPFCELGNHDFNHDLRLLLLLHGEQNLAARTSGWQLSWDWYRDDLRQHLKQGGVVKAAPQAVAGAEKKRQVGRVPLLDLVRKGDVEGVRLALESGASIEISPRARRYGQEPLFNIPARRKDNPEAAVEIARLLIEAGSDVNVLNRRGCSLRIHYDRYYSKASRALCAYFKECGSLIHPDSPDKREEVEQSRKAAQERAAAFAARIAAAQDTPAEEPSASAGAEPAAAPAVVDAEQTAEPVAVPRPEPAQPVVQQEPAQPEETTVAPVAEAGPTDSAQPVETPAVPEPAPEEPQPEPVEPSGDAQPDEVQEPQAPAEPIVEPPAEQPAPVQNPEPGPQPDSEHMKKLLSEVQSQLAELQAKYEAEQKARDAAAQEQQPLSTGEAEE